MFEECGTGRYDLAYKMFERSLKHLSNHVNEPMIWAPLALTGSLHNSHRKLKIGSSDFIYISNSPLSSTCQQKLYLECQV